MEKAEGYKVKVIGIIGAMEEEVAMLKEKAGKKREEGRMEQMSLFDFIKE